MVAPTHLRPTREAALGRLGSVDFTRAGKGNGVGDSASPTLPPSSVDVGHRLVLESEVLRAASRGDAAGEVERGLAWQGFARGWLAYRPRAWTDYRRSVEESLAKVESRAAARRPYLQAVLGETGIERLDRWANQLISTGELEMTARLAFASAWIFSLRLPWVIGADFFDRHLLDSNAAFNLCSWRWVAGLDRETPFLIDAAAFESLGGTSEDAATLSVRADALVDPQRRNPRPPESLAAITDAPGTGLLVLGNDLCLEHSPLRPLHVRAVAGGWPSRLSDAMRLAEPVAEFGREGIADALRRASSHFQAPRTELREREWLEDAHDWTRDQALSRIVVLDPGVGPWDEIVAELARCVERTDVEVVRVRRDWDALLLPASGETFDELHAHFLGARGRLVEAE
jgi:deoxyribodipyrimidine photo-lyase